MRSGWTDEGNVWYALEGVKEACAPDARLIAAAPELLEALRWTIRQIDPVMIETAAAQERYDAAVAAITKAIGEQA
jgi:hypothetical protein